MRLIDADAYETDVRKRYCKHCDNGKGLRCRVCWINDMLGKIENAPTIEAKPVVHAHWEEVRKGCHVCSRCKVKAPLESDEYDYMEDLSDYCPRCGAQMDELVSKTDELNSSVKIPVISIEDVPKIMEEMEK